MSVQDSARDMSSQSEMSKVLEDQSFVSSILNSVYSLDESNTGFLFFLSGYIIVLSFFQQLPGVDPNDPSLKDLLASLQGESEVCS